MPVFWTDTTVDFAPGNTSVGLGQAQSSGRAEALVMIGMQAQVFLTRRNSSSVIASAISYLNIP
jgi:hypothetical protein